MLPQDFWWKFPLRNQVCQDPENQRERESLKETLLKNAKVEDWNASESQKRFR